MKASHITEFKFDNGTYFAAHTDNGGFRVGMNDISAIEYPAGHPMRHEAESLTLESVEDFVDARIADGTMGLN